MMFLLFIFAIKVFTDNITKIENKIVLEVFKTVEPIDIKTFN